MICPRCGAGYRPGYSRCADCGVDLVREEADCEAEELEEVRFVTVMSSPDQGEITLACSILESLDINHFVQGESFSSLVRTAIPAWIKVPEPELQRAREALALIGAGKEAPEQGKEDAPAGLLDEAFDLARKDHGRDAGDPAPARLLERHPNCSRQEAEEAWERACALEHACYDLGDRYRDRVLTRDAALAEMRKRFPGFADATYENAFGYGVYSSR